jgi:hypothetical protein
MAKKGIPEGAFSDKVCNRLRALNIKIGEGKEDRAAAFAERDAANVKLDELEHGSDDHTLASVEYAEACRKIETLQHSIRWWHQEMLQTIAKADDPEQGELFGNSKDPLNLKPPPLEAKKPKAKKGDAEDPVEQHPHPSEKNTAKLFDASGKALPSDLDRLWPITVGMAKPDGSEWIGRPIFASNIEDFEAEIARRVGKPHGIRYQHGTSKFGPMALVASIVTKTGKDAVGAIAYLYNLTTLKADEIPASPKSAGREASTEPAADGVIGRIEGGKKKTTTPAAQKKGRKG